jgi:phytoene dehydrogenase-like protein
MTSPYVYPVGGFGAGLAEATARVLDANGGSSLTDQPIEQILQGDDGGACGVQCAGARVMADCIVASPECAPERVAERYQVPARIHQSPSSPLLATPPRPSV